MIVSNKINERKIVRSVSLFLLVCIVFSLCTFTSLAAGGAKITASSATGAAGSAVSVSFNLEENPGIWGIKLRISYDTSKLTLTSVTPGSVFAASELTLSEDLTKFPYIVVAVANDIANKTANGAIVTLNFTIKAGVANGSYPVTFEIAEANNINSESVSIVPVAGSITVGGSSAPINPPAECTHSVKTWKNTTSAKCTEKGTETLTCSSCGATFGTRDVAPLNHKNTEIRNKVTATTSNKGYTGDTYCKDCGILLQKGEDIPKITTECTHPESEWRTTTEAKCEVTGEEGLICKSCGATLSTRIILPKLHANTEIRNSVIATTSNKGYTGDTYCKDCGTFIRKGEDIPMLSSSCVHSVTEWRVTANAECNKSGTESRVCVNCGEAFETKIIPSTGHINTIIRGAVAASLTANGYTGDTYCRDCNILLESGSVILKLSGGSSCAHGNTEWRATVPASCTSEGEESRICLDCGATVEARITDPVNHTNTEIRNSKEASQDNEGYTGDTHCRDCGILLKNGEAIPKLPAPETEPCKHSKTDKKIITKATCDKEGTEAEICSACGETVKTKTIKSLAHKNTEIKNASAATSESEGYSGDTYCRDCGKLISRGKATPKLEGETSAETAAPTTSAPDTTEAPDNAPTITSGINLTFNKDSAEPLVFVSSADLDKFIRAEIDGKELSENHYTVEGDFTTITVKPDYLNTINNGYHTVSIVSASGTASVNFKVSGSYDGELPVDPDADKGHSDTIITVIVCAVVLIVAIVGFRSYKISQIKQKRRMGHVKKNSK